MKKYAVYDSISGAIMQITFADNDQAEALSLPPGFAAVPVADDISDSTHYFQNGVLTLYPPRPGPSYFFDYASGLWVDSRNINAYKLAKWGLVKKSRDAAANADLVFNSNAFQADDQSRMRLQQYGLAALQAAVQGQPLTVPWVLADNSVVSLTRADILAIMKALMDQMSAAYTKAQTLRAQINAATTRGQVDAVTW